MTSATFKNNTEYPIIVESWKTKMRGLEEYTGVTVLPGETITMISSVGEWGLSSLFGDKEHIDKWEKAGLYFTSRIAKFRTEPCFNGDYTWNFIGKSFTLTYEDGVFIWGRGTYGLCPPEAGLPPFAATPSLNY